MLAACAAALLTAPRASAQIPYTVFDERTEVRKLSFRFIGDRTFEDGRLEEEIGLTSRGALFGLRRTLAFLPLVSRPAPHPFTPIDLQRDVARLRRFYGEQGFLETAIGYNVDYDADHNVVNVEMVITEGRPITVRQIRVTSAGGADLPGRVPEEYRPGWVGLAERIEADTGLRYTQAERARHETEVVNWWRDRGWAFAEVTTRATIDSAAAAADLTIALAPGARTRIGSIAVEGEESVSERVITRVLPFKEGDWFSARLMAVGQRRVFALELFRLALIDVLPDSTRDSTAIVRVRVTESPPRLLTGELGYVTVGGVSTQGQFLHRNFTGGARSLRVNAVAETGRLAVDPEPAQEYRLSVTYRTPWFFHPRLSLNVSPLVHYRDNLTDRSWQAGLETSLIYDLGPYRYVTLQHRYTTRRVLDYRLGSGNAIDLLTLLDLLARGALDSIGRRTQRSTLTLAGTIGRFDPTRPVETAQARPSIEVTTPRGLNTIEYFAADLPILAYKPLGSRVTFVGRARIGRVWPFGKTVRGDSLRGLLEALELRDVLLTAGGTSSVRGWGEGLLGPKFVNLVFRGDPDTTALEAEVKGYAPSGGMARATLSAELQLPFPGLGEKWRTFLFLDGGKVWTPDDRFRGSDPYDERRWFFGAGAGIEFKTLVGPVRIAVGTKLNPSVLDLRDAEKVFDALVKNQPVTSVPVNGLRRYHLHISLGPGF